jgi:hypothetical protein
MSHPQQHHVEARPVTRDVPGRRPVLAEVVVASDHPDGNGRLALSPDELLYLHGRLDTITHGHGLAEVPRPEVVQGAYLRRLRERGVSVRPVATPAEGGLPALEKVVVFTSGPGEAIARLTLTPGQAQALLARCTQIALEFLHDNAWGGESAWNR